MFKLVRKTIRFIPFVTAALIFVNRIMVSGRLYDVGGDDTRLYYIFPKEILLNFCGNIISNNTLGTNGAYASVASLAPITLLALIVKSVIPFFNTQSVMMAINISGGFLFFYLLSGLFVKERSVRNVLIRSVSSLSYVLSVYLIRTVYDHQLLAIYIVGYFPAVLYFTFLGIIKDDMFYTLFGAFVYSLFSGTMLTVPWFGAALFSIFPALCLFVYRYRKVALKHAFLFAIVTVFLNASWLSHQVYPFIAGSRSTGILSKVMSQELRQNNVDLIQSLSHLNEPINQFSAYLRSSWSDRMNMQIYQMWGIVYFVLVLTAGLMLGQVSRNLKGMYLVTAGILLWTMTLVTPNFGDWNVGMFVFFNNRIPLFTMFRNMYDKFAYPMAFAYASVLTVSLVIVDKSIRNRKLFAAILVIVTAVTISNARTFLFPVYTDGGFSTRISGNFNPDYISLAKYIRNMHEPSRFLWLPLNFPSYSVIADAENPGHYYFGSSPLQFIAGSSDYTGFQSFATESDPDLNFKLMGLFKEKKYNDVARILQRMNVKYVIVDHQKITGSGWDRLNLFGIIESQTPEFYTTLLGKRLRDFGITYTLYEVNPNFKNDKIFLTDELGDTIGSIEPVTFKRVSESEYDIWITSPDKQKFLAFLEPYNSLWELSLVNPLNGKLTLLPRNGHTKIYRYGNGYALDPVFISGRNPDVIKRSGNGKSEIQLKLTFRPAKISTLANMLTLFSWITTGVILGATVLRRLLRIRSI